MDVEAKVMGNPGKKREYEYYKGLGYGEKAAKILALLTYGDRTMSRFLRDFDKEARLDKLYAWLLERPESTPQEAFRTAMTPKESEERHVLGNLFGMGGAKKTGKAMPVGASARGMASQSMPMEKGMVLREAVMMDEAVCAAAAPIPMGMPAPMPAPGMGGPGMEMREPVDPEDLATDSYEQIEEKDAKSVLTAPTSTFRMTTNTSSMGIVLNQIRSGRSVDLSQVRIEEILNYFDYDHGTWEKDAGKFRISTERYQKSKDKELLYVNVEAADQAKEKQNVILLLDVSGSMSSQNEVTQEAIATVISKLKEGDVISLVTYSSTDHTIFENHVVAGAGDREDLMGRILELEITGCTYGSAGIETAYQLGKKTYQKNASNQVILITDGDLNFGVTEKGGLKDLIEEKKKTGLFLSVIGTGLYNYKDDKLEVLTKHGNGTYCVINDLEDVERSVNQKYVSLTNVIAKDVKAQVEFNPRFVKKYRLLGYENRTLAHEDFKNDKVISEPYGSGGHGVALYELEKGDATGQQELKYQQAVAVPSEELCTIKVRFKEPLGEESSEISKAVMASAAGNNGNAKLAYFLYCLSEKLRDSDKLDEADEAFFKKMLESGDYKKLAGGGAQAVELLVRKVG